MRLLVFFDLPVKTKAERKAYTRFHRFLVKDGYDMVQLSVYARVCNGQDAVEKHVARLRLNTPPAGSVRYMQVTEKQFVGIRVLVGKKKRVERAESAAQLSFF